MCGFVGAAFLPEGASFDVDAGLGAISHRGPDDTSVVRVGSAVLGFARLQILDLTLAGRQPMQSPDGAVTIVFNGEIYNHHELRAELRAKGYVFRSRSDTEVVVHGYAAWGDAVIARLDGMFAIAIWDAHDEKLLLARDRPGKKPLFYANGPRGFSFASEPKALLAAGVPHEIDLDALVPLFAFGKAHAPRTMNRHVKELPAASTLVLRRGAEPVVRRYWAPPFDETVEVSDGEAIAQVRRLVERAVARRLEADVPLGAFLSGGVDSSIVVGVMAKRFGAKVRTFSIGFEGDHGFDETAYARRVAETFGTEHTEFRVAPASFDLVERLVWAHDGPFGDSSAIPTSIVSGLTREHATVALTGDGGDELFCGYSRFLAVEASERVPGVARKVAGGVGSVLGREGSSLRGRLGRALGRAELPLPDRLLSWTSYFGTDLRAILSDELLAEVDPNAALVENRALAARFARGTPLGRVLGLNWETYLVDDLLVKADRSSMMHSLELRSPFLDTELVEYVARLPDRMKRRLGERKWILRRAFADLVPDWVFTRKKMGFGLPLGAWFRTSLRSYVMDRLGGAPAVTRFVRADVLRTLLDDHMAGRADHGLGLWLLLTLEVWLERGPGRFDRP
ncbi:MAG: asparagine synthase (glutamine-hydrolyzing) [Myxococcales bacterium]|nr:asparagine synthase (glutamine-hydrolyzing) [Myxococcales bacterium]